MRQRLAQEAARILLESGRRDFLAAKRKAALHLNCSDTRNLPNNQEIEQALIEYQRLFHADEQTQELSQLRETACEAMRFFDAFSPRLVGPVLQGSADKNTPISLHFFADSPEAVGLFLLEQHIPFEQDEKRQHLQADLYQAMPRYRFIAKNAQVEVIVFPTRHKQPPLSPIDGRPMQRANLTEVELLLQQDV